MPPRTIDEILVELDQIILRARQEKSRLGFQELCEGVRLSLPDAASEGRAISRALNTPGDEQIVGRERWRRDSQLGRPAMLD